MKIFKFVIFLPLLLLGSVLSFADKKPLPLIQLKEAIKQHNQTHPLNEQINSCLKYELLYSEIPLAPQRPDLVYPDFKDRGGWAWLWDKKEKLTMDELKTAIANYNKKTLQFRRIYHSTSYTKFRKYIPNAPSHPYVFYPDFKDRGGWDFLLGRSCETSF